MAQSEPELTAPTGQENLSSNHQSVVQNGKSPDDSDKMKVNKDVTFGANRRTYSRAKPVNNRPPPVFVSNGNQLRKLLTAISSSIFTGKQQETTTDYYSTDYYSTETANLIAQKAQKESTQSSNLLNGAAIAVKIETELGQDSDRELGESGKSSEDVVVVRDNKSVTFSNANATKPMKNLKTVEVDAQENAENGQVFENVPVSADCGAALDSAVQKCAESTKKDLDDDFQQLIESDEQPTESDLLK